MKCPCRVAFQGHAQLQQSCRESPKPSKGVFFSATEKYWKGKGAEKVTQQGGSFKINLCRKTGHNWVFRQDNDPKQMAKSKTQTVNQNQIEASFMS